MIFAQMFNMVNAGIVIIDKSFTVQEWNRWMEMHSMITSEKIIGSSIFDFFPKLENQWFKRNCKSIFAFGNFYFFSQKLHQYLFPFKPNLISGLDLKYMQQNCTLGPLRDENNKISHIYILVQDVTELVAASYKLKKAIIHSQKMAEEARRANRTKTDFIANMSHEIRTPMNAILGFTELLEERIDNTKDLEYLNSISSSGNTLLKLINGILDLSKIEVGKLELNYKATDLKWVLNEVEQIFSKKINEKELNLIIEVDSALPSKLYLDETRFLQILTNLTGNAVKFTDSGFIRLSIQAYPNENNNNILDLEISVQDTGIGIHEDQKEVIFAPFTQQKKQNSAKYEGTGLGLTISKQLTEMMNGKISLESQVEKGSTFYLKFFDVSIALDETESEIPKTQQVDFRIFKNASVLIVDDKKLNRTLIADFLKDSLLKIIEAENGREAIELASLYQPDIILMDLKMPVMDGHEAIRHLKNDPDLKKIPIVVITATTVKQEAEKLKKLGCPNILTKPVSKAMLFKELCCFLPFNDKDTGSEQKGVLNISLSTKKLTPSEKENLHSLLHLLNNKMMTRWNRIAEAFFVDEIELFAQEIKELGDEYNINLLSNWGGKLNRLAEAFDMEKLPNVLNDYPKLVNKLTDLMEM